MMHQNYSSRHIYIKRDNKLRTVLTIRIKTASMLGVARITPTKHTIQRHFALIEKYVAVIRKGKPKKNIIKPIRWSYSANS